MTIISILGRDYEFKRDNLNNPELGQNDGFCEIFDKKICVRERKYLAGNSEKARRHREEHVIRHELVHAIAQESGVEYGDNEPLVDWIAHIIPYINNAFEELKEAGEI